jgi:DNA-binding transcriptional LysR family regulator
MDRLGGIVAFVRTADLGSFVQAGRMLSLSPSAVGKAVARLEQELGTRLLQRSTRSLRLTEEGQEFYERCRRILDELDDAQASLLKAQETPRGRLKVSVPVIGYYLVMPLMPAFLARYPDIELDLDCSDRLTDLIDEGVDVAIRGGVLTDSRLMARAWRPYQHLICAAPAYLEKAGEPQVPRDLDRHETLRFRFSNSGKLLDWPLRLADGEIPPQGRTVMVCNNMEALYSGALSGMGIACLPDLLARDAVQSGRLKSLLTEHIDGPGQFSLLWPSNRHLSPKIRVFVDFLSGDQLSSSRPNRPLNTAPATVPVMAALATPPMLSEEPLSRLI